MPYEASIGVIGGTGSYELELKNSEELKVSTPFGEPSDFIQTGSFHGRRIAFIPRHGKKHRHPPHQINYRANISALKEIGVSRVISLSTVGSLRKNLKIGTIVIPDQFLDFTKNRISSFYHSGGQVCHLSVADPFCNDLREQVKKVAKLMNITIHDKGTYTCIEGPRFSTKSESRMFQMLGGDVIGMTVVPECVLAKEMCMCYLNIATVTDYDVWASKTVDAATIAQVSRSNQSKVNAILEQLIPSISSSRKCKCSEALKDAIY